jgi:hypothetical protein
MPTDVLEREIARLEAQQALKEKRDYSSVCYIAFRWNA